MDERVSHFRPFKDFSRISILNTVLVTIALLYIKPRDLFRSFKKKSLSNFIKEDILGSKDSNKIKALSIALGVFTGILPIWGAQTFVVITLSVFLGWNKVLAFAFSNISVPPMIPLIIWLSLQVGSWVLPTFSTLSFSSDFDVTMIGDHLLQYVVGSIILAVIVAVIFGLVSYLLLSFFNKKNVETIKTEN